jgi:hypothetical protein
MLKAGHLWPGSLPVTPASQVHVAVLNGTGIAGLAGQAAASLKKLGFDVVSVGDAAGGAAATTVSYPGTAAAGGAYTVAQDLTATPATESTASSGTGSSGPITLTIGSNFSGVVAPPTPAKPGATPSPAASQSTAGQQASVETRNAAQNICSGVPDANPDP